MSLKTSHVRDPPPTASAASRHYYHAKSLKLREIRELIGGEHGGGRSTLHVELEMPAYTPACTMVLIPENDPVVVKEFGQALGWNLDEWFDLPPDAGLFPTPCSFEQALSRYCALTAVPDKDCLRGLAPLCEDPAACLRLVDEYTTLVEQPKLSLYEVCVTRRLITFKQPNEPARFLLACPRMMAREYTVASSPRMSPDCATLLVSVVSADLGEGRKYMGVCTHALHRRLTTRENVWGYVKSSTFSVPVDAKAPCLYVATGTGLAPMRALLQERKVLLKENGEAGPAVLLFGVRGVGEVYYQDELNEFLLEGVLTRLCVCYSRDPPEGVAKARVTDVLKNNEELKADVAKILADPSAHMFVCGLAKAGHDVKACVTHVLGESGLVGDATHCMETMAKSGRLQEELWG